MKDSGSVFASIHIPDEVASCEVAPDKENVVEKLLLSVEGK